MEFIKILIKETENILLYNKNLQIWRYVSIDITSSDVCQRRRLKLAS